MKKKIIIALLLVSALAVFASGIIKPKTTKYKFTTKSGLVYYIYMTEIYSSEYWKEVYMTYEVDNDTYDEAVANKRIYEFISTYKVKHKFSKVEIEDLREAAIGDENTTIEKRLIFRQIRK